MKKSDPVIPNCAAGDNTAMRKFLFLLASTRVGGNAELLARRAAAALPEQADQCWLRLSEIPLESFVDTRHDGDGIYPEPSENAQVLLERTLAATDIVFVAPLYWYGVPTLAKNYLDHWSGWMRVPTRNFKAKMAGKNLWVISSYSGGGKHLAEPLMGTFRFTGDYMKMHWAGSVLGEGNRPGDVLNHAASLADADRLFADHWSRRDVN